MRRGNSRATASLVKAGLTFATLLLCRPCFAVKNYFEIPQSDLKLLPPFCRTGFGTYGLSHTDMVPLNHLCPGLYALLDAQRRLGTSTERSYAISQAVSHLSHTLNSATPAFPFRATVLIKRGNAYEMQGERGKAIADYNAAVAVQPKNLLGYLSLCNAYIKINDKKSAADAAGKGLTINPKANPLLECQRRATGH